MKPGRYDIDGDTVYALVQEYDSKPKSEGFWEAHHAYLDVQYVASGAEHMGYRPVKGMEANPYDEEKDFYTLDRRGGILHASRGLFHYPKAAGCAYAGHGYRRTAAN